MIQFNLLPDVKLEYIKAQRAQRMVMSAAFIVSAVAVGLLVLLFGFSQVQKKHINDLDKDIQTASSQLKSKPDIDKILTVQNQLTSLTGLHSAKPAVSRILGDLNQITPSDVSISSLSIDTTAQTMKLSGGADSLSSINRYVDTLKFTTYRTKLNGTVATPAFSSVVLAGFGLTGDKSTTGGKSANYNITFAYDKNIFDITQDVNLTVPSLTTTRSVLDISGGTNDLFQANPSGNATPTSPAKGQQ